MVEIITGSFSFPGVFFSSFFSFKFVRCLWLFNIRDNLISGGKSVRGEELATLGGVSCPKNVCLATVPFKHGSPACNRKGL